MRTIAAKLTLVAAITGAVAFGADSFEGTWKLNMDKSKFTPAPIVKTLTTTRESVDGGMKATSTGELPDGAAINSTYTAKFDGKPVLWTNGPGDSIAVKKVNNNTFTSVATKKGTKYKMTSRMVVAPDGKTMTVESHGVNAEGKPSSYTMVYDKQ
jgi:hypothetical protein